MAQVSLVGDRTTHQHPLLARARRWSEFPDWRDLTADTLRQVTASQGIDFATALLYVRLCDSAEHGPAIACLEASNHEASNHEANNRALPAREVANDTIPKREISDDTGELAGYSTVRVAIVPGGCHEESADSRQCLQRVQQAVERFGLAADVVPTLSFGGLRENAARLVAMLRSRSDVRWIVVSMSKGSAEVKLALRDDPAAFGGTTAWVNLSGMLYGSQWVRWLLDRSVSHLAARGWCWYWRYRFADLEQLRQEDGSPLDFDSQPPPHLRVVHLAGFPLAGDLTHRYTERSFQRLANLGPNDGMGVMLGDLVRASGRAGGVIYPVWRADHFLRPGEHQMQDFVARSLRWLTMPQGAGADHAGS